MRQVLIVDDEPTLLLSIESGFEDERDRYLIHTASNGKEALDILVSRPIDLVVTDLRMPVMDGFELLAAMSERFPHIPAIVMSAFGTPSTMQRLEKAGAIKFLDKPLDFDALKVSIDAALADRGGESGTLSGISLGSFMQLIDVEQKTCMLRVNTDDGLAGRLYFQRGRLIEAECGDLRGDDAAIEMLTWDQVRLMLEALPEPAPAPRIQRDLMLLLMEGSKLKDEREAMAGPVGVGETTDTPVRLDEGEENEKHEPAKERTTSTNGGPMAGLKDTLKEMADEMDGVLAVVVTGMDGITIAVHNPTGYDVDAFSAKFAMIMKLADKSVGDLSGMGDFEECLIQTQNAWILTRFLGASYYMGIAVSRDGTLGNVRLVAQKYLDQLRRGL